MVIVLVAGTAAAISGGASLTGGGLIGAGTVAYILQILGAVCSLVAFFMCMGYLRKAIKAVEGVPTAEQ